MVATSSSSAAPLRAAPAEVRSLLKPGLLGRDGQGAGETSSMRQPMPFGGKSWLSTCAAVSLAPVAQARQKAPEGGMRRAAPDEVRRQPRPSSQRAPEGGMRRAAPAEVRRQQRPSSLRTPEGGKRSAAPAEDERLLSQAGCGIDDVTAPSSIRSATTPMRARLQPCPGEVGQMGATEEEEVRKGSAPAPGAPASAPSRISSILARVRAKEARARSAC